MNISQKIQALNEIISDANLLILDLRKECDHADYTAKYDANTGNWCQSDDSYWVVLKCPTCGHSELHDSVNTDGSRNEKYYGHHGRESR